MSSLAEKSRRLGLSALLATNTAIAAASPTEPKPLEKQQEKHVPSALWHSLNHLIQEEVYTLQTPVLVDHYLHEEGTSGQLLSTVLESVGIATEPSTAPPGMVRYRPLDPVPQEVVGQARFFTQANEYMPIGRYLSLDTLGDLEFHTGDVLFVRTTESVYGVDQFSHVFLPVLENGEVTFLNLQSESEQDERLSAAQVASSFTPTDEPQMQLFITNVFEYQQLQRRVEELAQERKEVPLSADGYPQMSYAYANIYAWGAGERLESTGNYPATIPQLVDEIFRRHYDFEQLIGREIPKMHVDVIWIDGYGNRLDEDVDGSGTMDTEEFMWALYDRARQEGKDISFSFDIQIPPGWTTAQTAAHPGDLLFDEIQELFGEHSPFSQHLLTQLHPTVSIDPEMAVIYGNQLSADDYNNLHIALRLLGLDPLSVYDWGTTLSDSMIYQRPELYQPIRLVYDGIGQTETKREGVANMIRESQERSVIIMVYLNPNHGSRFTDRHTSDDQVRQLFAPFEDAQGNEVPLAGMGTQ